MNNDIYFELGELNPEALRADGFEDAYLGCSDGSFMPCRAIYSRSKCISILVDRDGMSYEEAVEFFEFNVTGAYVGESTPIFMLDRETDDETEEQHV